MWARMFRLVLPLPGSTICRADRKTTKSFHHLGAVGQSDGSFGFSHQAATNAMCSCQRCHH